MDNKQYDEWRSDALENPGVKDELIELQRIELAKLVAEVASLQAWAAAWKAVER